MRYIITSASESYELEKKVQKYLNNKWELCGGVSVSSTETREEYSLIFAQAMIKK